jgi:hypothetical protein
MDSPNKSPDDAEIVVAPERDTDVITRDPAKSFVRPDNAEHLGRFDDPVRPSVSH